MLKQPTIDREKFAGAIRAHCRDASGGLSAFARRLKLAPSTMSRAANATKLPSADNFMKICVAMDRSAEEFLERKP